jgi:hypothetical protein
MKKIRQSLRRMFHHVHLFFSFNFSICPGCHYPECMCNFLTYKLKIRNCDKGIFDNEATKRASQGIQSGIITGSELAEQELEQYQVDFIKRICERR